MLFQKKHKIGDTIAKLRKEKGWTQNELANKLQVSDKAISKWESNKGDPSIEFLPALAELFGATLDYLMTGKEVEEKIITMSKLELCAKKDDPNILKDFSYSSAHTKDEDGNTLLYYVKKYNSLKVLKALVDNCSHQTHYMSLFPKNEFDLPELLLLIKINREQIVMKNIASRTPDIRLCLNNFSSNSIWKDGNNKDDISSGYKEIFKYLLENYDKLEKSQQIYYFDLDNTTMICKQTCWSYAYPYFIDYAYRYNKKLLTKLLEKIINSNKQYREKIEQINKEGKNEFTWIDYQKRALNEKYQFVNILSKTVLYAIDCEDYEMAHQLNELVKDKIDEDVFEQAKISKNKKLSDKEKQLLHCIHNGVVCLDELISLNDFDLYEKTIKKYPICECEEIYYDIKNKNYKALFQFANLNNINYIINDLQRKEIEKIESDFAFYVFDKGNKDEINKRYLDKYINKTEYTKIGLWPPHHPFKLRKVTSFPAEIFDLSKNYIFLLEVLDKDIRFIEKASKTATQQELDDALTKIQPNNFKGINILLSFGAKLHKTWEEDDGWGYMVNKDEIDEIGTEVLKQKIKDILGDK